ncbi:hypothetical protein B4Q13_20555 [Lacticaseibacillus rhamnosus]
MKLTTAPQTRRPIVSPPQYILTHMPALLAGMAPAVLLLGGDYVYLQATPAVADELAERVASVPAALKLG